MGIRKRGGTYSIRYAGPDGQIIEESTGQGDARVADRMYRERKREVAAGTWQPREDSRVTVAAYAERWIARQHDRGLSTARDYEQRTRDHVLPALGGVELDALRPRHVRDFVEGLKGSELAPRTIHHVYDCLRSMCRDAVIDEVIRATPCVLPPGTLPPKRDKDPRWRATAIYTRAELEALIADRRIPQDRRVLWALMFLTGCRFGEVAGLRWRDYDRDARPLGRLLVATQYTGRKLKGDAPPREVPAHPALASVLEEWRSEGFGSFFARAPRPDDFLIPSRRGRVRSVRHSHRKLGEDCERLGFRRRRQHDTRRTFISLARADGARPDVLRVVTHGPSGDVFDLYTTLPWATLCEAVACLRIGGQSAPTTAAAPPD